jgi:hypothetical protein
VNSERLEKGELLGAARRSADEELAMWCMPARASGYLQICLTSYRLPLSRLDKIG